MHSVSRLGMHHDVSRLHVGCASTLAGGPLPVVVKATPTKTKRDQQSRFPFLYPTTFGIPFFFGNHGQAEKVVPETASISVKKARPTRYVHAREPQ